MFSDFVYSSFFWNKIIFYTLLTLFLLAGRRLANHTTKNKKENKTEYYSIILSCPVGFLISFFVVAAINKNVMGSNPTPSSLLIDWVVVLVVGIVLSFLIYYSMIKKYYKSSKLRP